MEDFYIVDTKSGILDFQQLQQYLKNRDGLEKEIPSSVPLQVLLDGTLTRLSSLCDLAGELQARESGRVLKGEGLFLSTETLDESIVHCTLRRVSPIYFDPIWNWLKSISQGPKIKILSQEDSSGLSFSEREKSEKYYAITGQPDPQKTTQLGRLIDTSISWLTSRRSRECRISSVTQPTEGRGPS